jgi:hypothetical protein
MRGVGQLPPEAVRFSRYAYPGDDIDASVCDAAPIADGPRAHAFAADSVGEMVPKNGRVEVSLAV